MIKLTNLILRSALSIYFLFLIASCMPGNVSNQRVSAPCWNPCHVSHVTLDSNCLPQFHHCGNCESHTFHSTTGGIGFGFDDESSSLKISSPNFDVSKSCFNTDEAITLLGEFHIAVPTNYLESTSNGESKDLVVELLVFRDKDLIPLDITYSILPVHGSGQQIVLSDTVRIDNYNIDCRPDTSIANIGVTLNNLIYQPYDSPPLTQSIRNPEYKVVFYIRDVNSHVDSTTCSVVLDPDNSYSINNLEQLEYNSDASCHIKDHLIIQRIPFCSSRVEPTEVEREQAL